MCSLFKIQEVKNHTLFRPNKALFPPFPGCRAPLGSLGYCSDSVPSPLGYDSTRFLTK